MRGSTFFVLLLAATRTALALDPALAITQFVHTSWTERDGAPNNVRALAQTRDGYLWMGTTAGLFRFDGVRFTAFEPAAGEALPTTRILGLLTTRDGALWIVWAAGPVTRLENGHVTTYSAQNGLPAVADLAESTDGTVVAATTRGLSRFEAGTWKDVTKDWNFPGKQAKHLYFDKAGSLWVETEDRSIYLPRGQGRFVDPGNAQGLFSNFAEGPDGAIWVSDVTRSAHTLRKEHNEGAETEVRVGAGWVLFDRDGSLWIGSVGDGLRRVPYPDRIRGKQIAQFGPEAEVFTAKDGLSSSIVRAILEDREGNIWCGTNNGIDRFRRGAFQAVNIPNPDKQRGIFPTKDGSLWATSANPAEIVRIAPGGDQNIIGVNFTTVGICEDESGAVWSIRLTNEGPPIYRFRQDRIGPFPLPGDPGLRNISAVTCDHAGGVWMFDAERGLFRMAGRALSKIADSTDPSYRTPKLYTDGQNRVWLGMRDSIEMFDHGSERRFDSSQGLTVKLISAFAEDNAGNVWAGGEGGLARFDRDRFLSLSRSSGLPAPSITGLVEDGGGYWWIACDTGVLRVRADELEHALRDPAYRVSYEVFNLLDGLPARPVLQRTLNLSKTADGRIWVATTSGIAYADPGRIPRNPTPPPVRVESMKVNGKEIAPSDGLALSPGSNDLEIDYTAPSLTVPERVRFKYKLEGHDSEWKDAGGRRQAYYGGLGPKRYRFRVIAANDSGVWNNAGASFDFSIEPAYYQTVWFSALMAVIASAILWGLHRYRLHQVALQFNSRLEVRVSERMRLARDLHDTLLQSFHGLMLRLQVVDTLLPQGKAKEQLATVLERADQAIAEGRSAVYDLRSSATTANDLSEALNAVRDELSKDGNTAFDLTVEGPQRDLHPIIRDEGYRISREALSNAFKHAHARHIEAEINYGRRAFRLRIRDDGDGIPDELLERGLAGHFGLPGMRERAKQIGAGLTIWSRPGSGTEIDLSVGATIAYRSPRRSLFRLFQRGGDEK